MSSDQTTLFPLTKAVHCRKEESDVYIGRPSKWGNPFTHLEDVADREGMWLVGTVKEAVEEYRKWIMEQPELLKDLHELKGKKLGCWCKPGPCHGDVLAELADNLAEKED